MDTVVVVMLGLGAALVAVIAYAIFARIQAWKTRRQKIAEWAQRNGMRYATGPQAASSLAPLRSLQLGDGITSCEATHMARGTRAEMPVVVFDLARTTERQRAGEKSTGTERGTFALFERADVRLPRFEFAALSTASATSFQGKAMAFAMNLAAKVGGPRVGTLVTLEGRPGFLLRGDDEAAVRTVFSPSLLEFFDQNEGWTVEAEGTQILVGFKPLQRPGWTVPEIDELVSYRDLDKFLPLAAAIAQRL
jgi:hypothetical protein